MHAFMNADMLPATIALAAVLTIKLLLLGANVVNVAISIPIVPTDF